MTLNKKDFEGDHINVDKYTLNDFGEYRGDDLFEVTEYFWEYVQEGMRRKYMVYGHPMMSSPKTEFEVFDRNADSVRTFLNFCSYNYL
ncbi:MAG: hypothetical protein KJ727_03240, partial [Acidobacteria bacterium]|nr:hypothetical protein [Acidobacteriota bacterium]